MNTPLADSFKQLCDLELRQIINSCYILISVENRLENKKFDSTTVCEIYSPFSLCEELIDSQDKLLDIANQIGIEIIDIIPFDPRHLVILKRQALETNDPVLFKKYLNFLYLF